MKPRTNRLIHETSLYLLQQAHNLVGLIRRAISGERKSYKGWTWREEEEENEERK